MDIPALRGDPKYTKIGQQPPAGNNTKTCCGPGWQLNAILIICFIGLILFGGLMIGILASKDEMQATTRATISMHDEAMEMKATTSKWVKQMKETFPANQDEMTLKEILGTIDKIHETVVWVDKVLKGIPANSIQSIMHNADLFIGNATLFVEVVTSVFNPQSGAAKRSLDDTLLVAGAGNFLKKSAELINSISPDEFHQTFITVQSAIDIFVRLSRDIDSQKINSIVKSTSDILSAADSSHIVDTISKLSNGAFDVIHRFSQPDGLRVSLPVSMAMVSSQK